MKLNIQLFAASKSTTFSEPALTDAMISGNYSTLKIKIVFSANNDKTYFTSKTLACTVNGVTQTAKVSLSKGGSVTKTFTFTNIPHNEDGTKSVEWAWGIETGTSVLGYLDDDGTRTLQQINRLGYFSGDKVTGNTSLILTATTLTLHYDIFNLDYNYKYLYYVPNHGSYTGTLTPTGLTNNTKDLSFNYEVFQYNPTANDLNIDFYIETYNGDTLLGSDKTTVNVTLDNYYVPNIYGVNITEASNAMQNLNWGIFVKNKSQLKFETYIDPSIGSNLVLKTIEVDGTTYILTYNPYTSYYETTTNALKTSGTNTITATAVDARERTKTISSSINVVDYENPTITTFEVQRCLQDGTIDKNGTYLIYTAVGSISPVENNNASTFRLGYRVQGTDNYTYITLGSSYTLNITNQISSFTISSSDIYDVVLEAIDTFTTTTITRTIDVGFDLLNFNASGKAMAIGKVSTASANDELLEVDLETNFEKNVNIDGDLSVTGTIDVVGDLTTLTTTDKTDVVSAINEIAELKPVVLFTNSTGSTGNITLSETSANFDYLEIYYKYSTSDSFGEYFSKIDSPNGNKIVLNLMVDNNNYCYQCYCQYSISGTTMTKGTAVQWRMATSGNNARSTPTIFAITKVVGYK